VPKVINVHAAKTHLSRLIDRAAAGEEIVIARGGRPVARLCPLERASKRQPGLLRGRIRIAKDFDTLPLDLLRAFYDGPIEPSR
jgi:prevent-host-death family protein